jgi:hypothetical protein
MASMIKAMTEVASECLRNPKRDSYWSAAEKRYICPESAQVEPHNTAPPTRPPLQENFKLVFLAAFGGTILFTLICVGCHLATGGEPPAGLQRLIDGLLDMAKIGFGAVVGLLGAKSR